MFRYIYNYEEGLEVTNDGFVKFFINIDKFRWDKDSVVEQLLAGWIKRIMINTAIDLLRKKMFLPEIGGDPDHFGDLTDKSASADQALLYKDLIKQVKRLPPTYRAVFNMYVIDGYTHIEISEALNIPIGTSKSNLMRAKQLMQNFLNQKEALTECSI